MFNQESLEVIFKEKRFGYGKWHLYLYAEGDYSIEEVDCDVALIMSGILEITQYATDDNHERTEVEAIDYIPIERITYISLVKDF